MADDFRLLDATAQAELVRRREASPIELVDAAIRRIELSNPVLNAVVTEQFERAREAARGATMEGPLAGVPFLVKDLNAADPGVRMTQGSRFLEHYVPDYESEIVRRFKKAGLVIVGRTNTPEFGIPPTTEPALFGATKNPWSLAHSTGGSSGGAAAAVAARLVPAAHASDGGGSIRIPASCSGIFGLKPTRARSSMGPKIGESVGGLVSELVVSVSVRDTALMLDVVSGSAPGDPYVAPPKARPYVEEVRTAPGRLRIALQREPLNGAPLHPDCRRAVDDAAELCRELGHDVVLASPSVGAPDAYLGSFLTVWTAAAAMSLRAAERVAGRPATADDVEPLTWALASMGRERSALEYVEATRMLHQASREVARFFAEYDVLLSPVLATPPVRLGELACPPDEPLRGFFLSGGYAAFTPLFNVTGQPAMSVPLFWNADGLPIGTQFVGRFGDEATLLRLAAELERARPWAHRVPPAITAGRPPS
jgi:amidase